MYEPSFVVYNEITKTYWPVAQLGFRPDPPKEVVDKAKREFFKTMRAKIDNIHNNTN